MSQVVIYLQHRTLDMWYAESPELPGEIGQASTLEEAIAPLKKALELKMNGGRKGRKNGRNEPLEVILYSQPLRRMQSGTAGMIGS